MSQDIFMKITGIEGESMDATHKGEIEVQSWHWGASQDSNMHIGSGGGAGKATVLDLTFEHFIDRASPNLMKYCITGKHLSQAVLTARKAGANPHEYLRITMHDVIISGVATSGSRGSSLAAECVSLSFSRVTHDYIVQNAQGGTGGTVSAIIDIKENRAI